MIAEHRGRYFSQRDNVKPYWISDGYVWTQDTQGKVIPLFKEEELEEKEEQLFDRSKRCFISSGTGFCEALWKAGLIATQMDEVAYEQIVLKNLKGNEDRYYWTAHERVINILIGHTEYEFYYADANLSLLSSRKSLDAGFPVLLSIWIKPYYPTGKGHIVLLIGYETDKEGRITGYYLDDPFGKVLDKYKDHDGSSVFIPMAEFKKLLASPSGQPRMVGMLRKKK